MGRSVRDAFEIETDKTADDQPTNLTEKRTLNFDKQVPSITRFTRVIAEEAAKHGEPIKRHTILSETLRKEMEILEDIKRRQRMGACPVERAILANNSRKQSERSREWSLMSGSTRQSRLRSR